MGNGAVGEEFSVESKCSIVVAGLGWGKKVGRWAKGKIPLAGRIKKLGVGC